MRGFPSGSILQFAALALLGFAPGCGGQGGGADAPDGPDAGQDAAAEPARPWLAPDPIDFHAVGIDELGRASAIVSIPAGVTATIRSVRYVPAPGLGAEIAIDADAAVPPAAAGRCSDGTTVTHERPCSVALRFAPSRSGTASGTLAIDWDAAGGGGTLQAEVRGEGKGFCRFLPERAAAAAVEARVGSLTNALTGAVRSAITPGEATTREAEIRALVPAMNGEFGIALDPDRIRVWDGTESMSLDLSAEVARILDPDNLIQAGTMPVSPVVGGGWRKDATGGWCLIAFSDFGLEQEGDCRTLLHAHELFHCYQYAAEAAAGMRATSRWLIEGGAEWVGSERGPSCYRNGDLLDLYLGVPRPLFARDYDAMPFYAHLANRGVAVRARLLPMDTSPSDAAAFAIAFGEDEGLGLATWPTGLWRMADWGPDWTTTVPGNPTPTREHPVADLGVPASEAIDEAKPALFRITAPEARFLRVTATKAFGGLLAYDGTATAIDDRIAGTDYKKEFCYGAGCRCPDGGRPAEAFVDLGGAEIDVALVARPGEPGALAVTGFQPTCCGEGPGLLDPRLVGSWEIVLPDLAELIFQPLPYCDPGTATGFGSMTVTAGGGMHRSASIRLTRVCHPPGGVEQVSTISTRGSTSGCLRTEPSTIVPGQLIVRVGIASESWETDDNGNHPYDPHEFPGIALHVGKSDGLDDPAIGNVKFENDDTFVSRESIEIPGARRWVRVSR